MAIEENKDTGVKVDTVGDKRRNKKQIRMEHRNKTYLSFRKDPNLKLPRILCWIMTDPDRLDRAIHVKETWAKHCDLALFMSSEQNDDFPTIGLKTETGKNHIGMKAKRAWVYLYSWHKKDYDYFVKTDEDSFLIVENLKQYLAKRDPEIPEFFGSRMYINVKNKTDIIYNSGGPGQVLSNKALRILVERAFGNKTHNCMPDGQGE